MHILKRILKYTKPYLKQFLTAIFFVVILAVINAIMPRVIQTFIDDYLTVNLASQSVIIKFGLLYMALTIVKMLVTFLELYIFSIASEKTVLNIRNQLFEKVHSLGMKFFDNTSTGWIITRVTNDTESLKDFWNVLLNITQSVLSVVTTFIAMLLLDWKISMWILAFVPLLLVITRFYQVYSSRTYSEMKSKNSILNSKLAESINGMSVIQNFRQEDRMYEEFEEVNQSYFDSRFSMTKINAILLSPVINFLYTLAIVAILGLFGYNALQGSVEVGVIYAFTSYVNLFFQPLTRLMDNLSLFQDGIISSGRILSVMDNEDYTPEQNEDLSLSIKDAKIEFKNVTFSYDNKTDVLKNISFTVQPGETLALVGHTGSGKSSIINILSRFYEFQEGDILIDNRSIREYPIEKIRKEIGLVLQDSFMFYGTIKDNIRLLDDSITDQEIVEAAKFVQADPFINQLSGKYEHKVVERGAGFSSGEKQLISFASTIVKDPKILILDEATANIDTETEVLIQEGLERMREGRTTVAIAHRLSTIRDADKILVLENGEIKERGNHDELIKLAGRYAEMYHLQNLN
ncbi:MAG: ABC transporter ATP-binding protein/permease [Atopostipes suicloacalis]|nr:ABC transporter ATP-binding protein/permease [Atopostipes suicloacalis]